jgi:hypothetical protein
MAAAGSLDPVSFGKSEENEESHLNLQQWSSPYTRSISSWRPCKCWIDMFSTYVWLYGP